MNLRERLYRHLTRICTESQVGAEPYVKVHSRVSRDAVAIAFDKVCVKVRIEIIQQ